MPTYDYQCRACNAVTEVIHSMLEAGPSTCEQCGGQLRRILYPAGIIFKGPGFYSTDSRSSRSNGSGSAETTTSSSSSSSSGTKEGGGNAATTKDTSSG